MAEDSEVISIEYTPLEKTHIVQYLQVWTVGLFGY